MYNFMCNRMFILYTDDMYDYHMIIYDNIVLYCFNDTMIWLCLVSYIILYDDNV